MAERNNSDTRLVFADHGFLPIFAVDHISTADPNKIIKGNPGILNQAMAEYGSIHAILVTLLEKQRLIFSRTKVMGSPIQIPIPDSQTLTFINDYGRQWLRDSWTYFDGKLYINPECWTYQDHAVNRSTLLGDGGRSVHRKNNLIVTDQDYDQADKSEIEDLQRSGVKIAVVPKVDPTKQRNDFNFDHIDGHLNILEDRFGKMHLLAAGSYANQSPQTFRDLNKAAQVIDADVIVHKDTNFPPLSYNYLQLGDGRTVVTSGATELLQTMTKLLGQKRVFPTRVPLRLLPGMCGGIRCLTNELPQLPQQYRFL